MALNAGSIVAWEPVGMSYGADPRIAPGVCAGVCKEFGQIGAGAPAIVDVAAQALGGRRAWREAARCKGARCAGGASCSQGGAATDGRRRLGSGVSDLYPHLATDVRGAGAPQCQGARKEVGRGGGGIVVLLR